MSENICVDDLVIVVKPTRCCGNPSTLGRIFRVTEVFRSTSTCGACGSVSVEIVARIGLAEEAKAYPLHRLKVIPPDLHEESKTRTEPEKEPA